MEELLDRVPRTRRGRVVLAELQRGKVVFEEREPIRRTLLDTIFAITAGPRNMGLKTAPCLSRTRERLEEKVDNLRAVEVELLVVLLVVQDLCLEELAST